MPGGFDPDQLIPPSVRISFFPRPDQDGPAAMVAHSSQVCSDRVESKWEPDYAAMVSAAACHEGVSVPACDEQTAPIDLASGRQAPTRVLLKPHRPIVVYNRNPP